MKKFNLKKALKGAKVVTKDGRKVNQITLFTATNDTYPINAVVEGKVVSCTENGVYVTGNTHRLDLFMADKTKKPKKNCVGWINVYKKKSNIGTHTVGNMYTTKQEAELSIPDNSGVVKTVKVKWFDKDKV